MGLITTLLDSLRGAPRAAVDENDERIWVPASVGTVLSQAGVAIDSTTALKVSCLFQGTRIRAETVAGLPLKIYREKTAGRDEARDHRTWPLLRRRPNAWQTPLEFREMLTAYSILYGIGAARKKPGPRGFADELIPFDPTRLTVLQNGEEGERIFEYRKLDGEVRRYFQDETFSVNGIALEPMVGAGALKLAREAMGLWLAREGFASRFFSQGVNPNIALKLGTKLDPEGRQALEKEQAKFTGPRSQHGFLLVKKEHEITELKGKSAREAQLTESIEPIVLDFARWLNVPKHMLHSGLQPTYASAEQMAQEFVDYTVSPDARRWEASIIRDLMIDGLDDDYLAEHVMEGLLRGNIKDRYAAYAIAGGGPWMKRNEIRGRENLYPVDGLDTVITPLNMGASAEDEGGETPPPPPPKRPARRDDGDDEEATAADLARAANEHAYDALSLVTQIARDVTKMRSDLDDDARKADRSAAGAIATRLARANAEALVKKEVARAQHLATKLAGKPAAWRSAVVDFYSNHAALVAQRLQLEPAVARRYCDAQRDELLTAGVAALDRWPDTAVRKLTDLALEEIRHEDRAA